MGKKLPVKLAFVSKQNLNFYKKTHQITELKHQQIRDRFHTLSHTLQDIGVLKNTVETKRAEGLMRQRRTT